MLDAAVAESAVNRPVYLRNLSATTHQKKDEQQRNRYAD